MSRLDGAPGEGSDGVSVVRAVADAMTIVDTRSCM
jgi:hypothetical protein